MKRNFNCSDSLTHFISHPLEGEMKGEEECINIYKGEGEIEEEVVGEKKRRLSNHQVKSLERMFEVDNKLDPDRKVKVAQDLGLQPRQVAIWFQNRRARWKTKQLERDYNLLKSNYDLLSHNYHKLEQDNQALTKQVEELKAKLHERLEATEDEEEEEDDDESKYDRDNGMFSGSDVIRHTNHDLNGVSDSDSSGVLNDIDQMNMMNLSRSSSDAGNGMMNNNSNSRNDDHVMDPATTATGTGTGGVYEQSDSYNDESCNIFLVDQAPNLCWYFRDHLT